MIYVLLCLILGLAVLNLLTINKLIELEKHVKEVEDSLW